MDSYIGVEFAEDSGAGMALVCSSWLTPRKTKVFWPPHKTYEQYNKALKNNDEPVENEWKLFKINKRLFETDDLLKARHKLKQAEDTSDLQSEDTDSISLKRKRRPPQKINNCSSDSDSEQELCKYPRPPVISKNTFKDRRNDAKTPKNISRNHTLKQSQTRHVNLIDDEAFGSHNVSPSSSRSESVVDVSDIFSLENRDTSDLQSEDTDSISLKRKRRPPQKINNCSSDSDSEQELCKYPRPPVISKNTFKDRRNDAKTPKNISRNPTLKQSQTRHVNLIDDEAFGSHNVSPSSSRSESVVDVSDIFSLENRDTSDLQSEDTDSISLKRKRRPPQKINNCSSDSDSEQELCKYPRPPVISKNTFKDRRNVADTPKNISRNPTLKQSQTRHVNLIDDEAFGSHNVSPSSSRSESVVDVSDIFSLENRAIQRKLFSLLIFIKDQNTQILEWIEKQSSTSISTLRESSTTPNIKVDFPINKSYFTSIGGKDVTNKTNNILKRCLTNQLASNFNFHGKRSNKRPFGELKLKSVILEAVKTTDQQATDSEIEGCIKALHHLFEVSKVVNTYQRLFGPKTQCNNFPFYHTVIGCFSSNLVTPSLHGNVASVTLGKN
ncbi:hypothetical protein FQR65_LT16108 [Abscondita terminalis]|nr:hypothetical protein FQR65_LT16108 [Abscondita terminalis]